MDAKRSLVHHVCLHHFDRNLSTFLVTDASRLHGLGFMAAQATRLVTSRNSMWIPQLKASQSQLRHHRTRVPGYSVGGREMPILLARLRRLLDPNRSLATDWRIPEATWRSCQTADLPILGKASPILI